MNGNRPLRRLRFGGLAPLHNLFSGRRRGKFHRRSNLAGKVWNWRFSMNSIQICGEFNFEMVKFDGEMVEIGMKLKLIQILVKWWEIWLKFGSNSNNFNEFQMKSQNSINFDSFKSKNGEIQRENNRNWMNFNQF